MKIVKEFVEEAPGGYIVGVELGDGRKLNLSYYSSNALPPDVWAKAKGLKPKVEAGKLQIQKPTPIHTGKRGRPALPVRPCAIMSCKDNARAKGFCATHYAKYHKLEATKRLPETWVAYAAPHSIQDIQLHRGRPAKQANLIKANARSKKVERLEKNLMAIQAKLEKAKSRIAPTLEATPNVTEVRV